MTYFIYDYLWSHLIYLYLYFLVSHLHFFSFFENLFPLQKLFELSPYKDLAFFVSNSRYEIFIWCQDLTVNCPWIKTMLQNQKLTYHFFIVLNEKLSTNLLHNSFQSPCILLVHIQFCYVLNNDLSTIFLFNIRKWESSWESSKCVIFAFILNTMYGFYIKLWNTCSFSSFLENVNIVHFLHKLYAFLEKIKHLSTETNCVPK